MVKSVSEQDSATLDELMTKMEEINKEREELEREAHVAINHGFDVEHVDNIPPTGRPGIRFANQLKFHSWEEECHHKVIVCARKGHAVVA